MHAQFGMAPTRFSIRGGPWYAAVFPILVLTVPVVQALGAHIVLDAALQRVELVEAAQN